MSRLQRATQDADGLLDGCCFVRKVIVTPTRHVLMPAEMMMANRVVRQFGQDYLLRCVFRDDNLTKLTNNKFRTMFQPGRE